MCFVNNGKTQHRARASLFVLKVPLNSNQPTTSQQVFIDSTIYR